VFVAATADAECVDADVIFPSVCKIDDILRIVDISVGQQKDTRLLLVLRQLVD